MMKQRNHEILLKNLTAVFLLVIFSVPQLFAADYLHNIRQHSQNCSSCHRVPSGNWATTRGYPDVAGYPVHNDCLGCHKKDFFSGPSPSICTVCHSSVSPRGAGLFAFPLRTRKGDFETIFPHNIHQDIIASNLPQDITPAHFVNASFSFDDDKKDTKPQFNNCTICHASAAKLPPFGTRKPLVDVKAIVAGHADPFKPTAEFFKLSPDNHASCFNCHYQNQKPTRNDCASCHRYTGPHVDPTKITRYSVKFNHETQAHVKDCTTCHIRITQNADLKTMPFADVPILTCNTSSCHGGKVKEEITKRNDSITQKTAAFECTYCHTSPIGGFEVPETHK